MRASGFFRFATGRNRSRGKVPLGRNLHILLDQSLVHMEHTVPWGDHAIHMVEGHAAETAVLEFQGEVPAGVVQATFQLRRDVQFA